MNTREYYIHIHEQGVPKPNRQTLSTYLGGYSKCYIHHKSNRIRFRDMSRNGDT